MTRLRKIAAHYVYTPRGFLRHGLITVNQEGKILSVATETNPDSLPGVEFYNGILIPGMVNAHTHLELSYLRDAIPSGGGFVAFAQNLREQRGCFTEQQRVDIANYYDALMWSEGVSVIGDICNGDLTFELKSRSKLHYHSFIEIFGLDVESASNATQLAETAKGYGLTASLTPHSTYSLNRKGFAAAAMVYDLNHPLSIHFMESQGEAKLFEGHGEIKKWYATQDFITDFTHTYDSPTDRIIKEIPTNRKLMLIHNTFAQKKDIDIINKKYEGNATWVLCPASNKYITGGFPPVDLLRKSGARIAVGTDSLASNQSLSLIEDLKMFKEVALEELLKWATINGAEALGVDNKYGSLEEGKCPGIVQLIGVDLQTMGLTPEAMTKRIL